MLKFLKKTKYLLPALSPIMIAVVAALLITNSKTAVPNKPTESGSPSHMLITGGGSLDISDEILQGGGAKISKSAAQANSGDPTPNSNGDKDPKQKPQTQNIPDANNQNNTQSGNNTQAVGNSSSASQNENSGSDNPDKPSGEQPQNTSEQTKPSEPQTSSEQPADADGQNPSANTQKPSAEPPSQGESDIKEPSDTMAGGEYFSTTIVDGETVNTRDYSFEIIHKHSELVVSDVYVYVGGTLQVQFKGNVLLSEGGNNIRVAVRYKQIDGRTFTVFCDYTVYVDLGNIVIITDLFEHETETNILSFTAYAVFDGRKLPVAATSGGEELTQTDDLFRAKLKSGENIITLCAEYNGHTAQKSYKIQCNASDELSVFTTLKPQTVHSDSISFEAYILNGTEKAKLTVIANGKTVKANGTAYTAPLKLGSNTVRFKVTDKDGDKSVSTSRNITIKYVPPTTPETAPFIKYINIKDGASIVGGKYTLDLLPVDCNGERIYHNGISVTLNGTTYNYSWSSEYTSYLLNFKDGKNTLDIHITDKDGRYSDYSYTVNCRIPQSGESLGTATVSIDANVLGLGYILKPMKVDIVQGESGADLLCRVLEQNGFEYTHTGTADTGFYLSRITKQGIGLGVKIPNELVEYITNDGLEWREQHFDDSLGEFDYCQGSGWMYSINDSFPNYSFSDAVFKDGDIIKIRFTLAYGKDIGGYSTTGGDGKNYDKTW